MQEYKLSAEAMVMVAGSSAGTQPKFYENGFWYKLDRLGYESIAEELSSMVLARSNADDFVIYERCLINERNGCRSANFLRPGESFISFQRLYELYSDISLQGRITMMDSTKERIRFVLDFVYKHTDLDCSGYLSKTLNLDCLILNADRHFNNLGIIANSETGTFRTAPIFDHGNALLSDYNRFPADYDLARNIRSVHSLPFSADPELQAREAGLTLKIDYPALMEDLEQYPACRGKEVLLYQLNRYRSVFCTG